MKTAFKNFEELDESSELKKDFEKFKKNNSYWLERDSLFEALAYEYGSEDSSSWDEKDKNLLKYAENISKNHKVSRYIDAETGLYSINHFYID